MPTLRSPLRGPLRSPLYGPLTGKYCTAGGGFDYAESLFPLGTEKGLLIRAKDVANQYQDTAGTTPADTANDPVARIDDTSNAAKDIDLLQPTASNTPTLTALTGDNFSWDFDGVTDEIEASINAGDLPADCSAFFSIKSTGGVSASEVPVSDASNTFFFGVYQLGSPTDAHLGAGTPTYHVDGNALAGVSRDHIYDAAIDGDWHIVEARNLDLSGWTGVGIANYTSFGMAGEMGHLIIVPTGANLTAQRSSLIAQMQADVGL